ncbi:MAG: hypothetical protein Q8N81_00335 [bacterium]|nr:hypothetical protein [bacterium]
MATQPQDEQQRPGFGTATKPEFHPDTYVLDANVEQPVFAEQGHPPVNQVFVNGQPMLAVSIGGFGLDQVMWPAEKPQAVT